MELTNLKNKLLQNPRFKKVFLGHDLAYDTAKMLIEARIRKGVTQERLAKMMKTKQASISRAESGTYLPSLGFILKIAKAYGTYVIAPRFGFLFEHNIDFTCQATTTHLENHEVTMGKSLTQWLQTSTGSHVIGEQMRYLSAQ